MTDPGNEPAGRDLSQAFLAVAAVLALVLSAALVPALTVPFPATDPPASADPDPARLTGEPGALGALATGEEVGVGGPVDLTDAPNGTNATHFVVESDRPAYWRTGAYGRYTGDGWERLGDATVAPPGDDVESARTLHQRITLHRRANGLPAAWKPERFDVADGADPTVFVTEGGALLSQRPVAAGTTYRVASDRSNPSPAGLRAAGTDYPEAVERYTRLPSDTPARVGDLTDRITSEADSPYETAVAVERWLEAEKDYRLDVEHDPGEPVADQFLFEMSAGYCEYFATSMVVMLRTQGIPARYVVGYAPGQAVGENTYRVRSIDAHAWVEVYFPDHGWVRFDPTPPAPRTFAERRALAREGATGDRRPLVEGSPGELDGEGWGRADPSSEAGIRDVDDGDAWWRDLGRDDVAGPPYEVSLNSDPVPGKEVVVTVTKQGMPIPGAVVRFDGDVVGRTDWNGRLRATVPYADTLSVSAAPPWSGTGSGRSAPRSAGAAGPTGDRVGDGGTDVARAVDRPALTPVATRSDRAPAGTVGPPGANTSDPDTYDLPTNVTFRVRGTPAAGRSFVLVPAIHGVPVADAEVRLGDRVVGRTAEDGRIRIDLSPDAPDAIRVAVHRGDVRASSRIELAQLRVDLDTGGPLSLPGQRATARVTLGGEPVSDARVWVDGEPVGTTREDGTVPVRLPDDDDLTIRAAGPYQSTERTIHGLYLLWGLVLGAVLGLPALASAGFAGALRWRGYPLAAAPTVAADYLGRIAGTLHRVARACWGVARRIYRLGVRGGVWLARAAVSTAILVGGTVLTVVQWATGAGGSVGTVAANLLIELADRLEGRSPRELVAAAPAVLGHAAGFLARSGRFAWLLVLGAVPFTGVALSAVVGADPAALGDRDGSADGDAPATDTGLQLLSVREVWTRFLALAGLSDVRTMTPTEIGRAARERGLPAGPVETITGAFRDVEYGGRPEEDALRELATDALGRLLDWTDDGDDGADGPAADPVDGGPDDPAGANAPGPNGGDD